MAALINCPTHGITYEREECPECKKYPYDSIFRAPRDKTEEWDMRPRKTIRPVLTNFAIAMEEKLQKNDHKSGWRTLPVEALFKLLMIELEEFKVAHEFFGANEARKELVDIANFCMMLHDRLGMEEDKNVGATK